MSILASKQGQCSFTEESLCLALRSGAMDESWRRHDKCFNCARVVTGRRLHRIEYDEKTLINVNTVCPSELVRLGYRMEKE